MWKEVNLLSTNFSAKHTPSASIMSTCMYSDQKTSLISICHNPPKSNHCNIVPKTSMAMTVNERIIIQTLNLKDVTKVLGDIVDRTKSR